LMVAIRHGFWAIIGAIKRRTDIRVRMCGLLHANPTVLATCNP
jgi:hypothetical protein